LSKEDDVRKYVLRRTVIPKDSEGKPKEGAKPRKQFLNLTETNSLFRHQSSEDPAFGYSGPFAAQASFACLEAEASRQEPRRVGYLPEAVDQVRKGAQCREGSSPTKQCIWFKTRGINACNCYVVY
jgi:hypothetical protein